VLPDEAMQAREAYVRVASQRESRLALRREARQAYKKQRDVPGLRTRFATAATIGVVGFLVVYMLCHGMHVAGRELTVASRLSTIPLFGGALAAACFGTGVTALVFACVPPVVERWLASRAALLLLTAIVCFTLEALIEP